MGIACRSSCETTSSKMNTFVAVFSCLLAASQAQVLPLAPIAGKTLVRAPAHDSASIAHHRLGGNFAYAIQTAEAFAEVTPKIAHQTIPIAEHTHVHQPALGLAHGAYAHGLAAPALAHGHYALPAGVAAVPAALPVAQ